MNSKRDAFGQEVWAAFNGEDAYEVLERSDGFVGFTADPKAYFRPYAEWGPHQQAAIAHAKGPTLDIGCGAGRVALHLQEQGLSVIAIDNSPLAIRVCKARGVKDARVLSIAGVGRFKPGSFQTLVLWGGNFGLVGTPARAKAVLGRLHRLTPPDGLILAESVDPYHAEVPAHLSYARAGRRRKRWAGQLKLRVRFRAFASDWFDYLLVSPAELRAVLKGSGWVVRQLFESGRYPYAAVLAKE